MKWGSCSHGGRGLCYNDGIYSKYIMVRASALAFGLALTVGVSGLALAQLGPLTGPDPKQVYDGSVGFDPALHGISAGDYNEIYNRLIGVGRDVDGNILTEDDVCLDHDGNDDTPVVCLGSIIPKDGTLPITSDPADGTTVAGSDAGGNIILTLLSEITEVISTTAETIFNIDNYNTGTTETVVNIGLTSTSATVNIGNGSDTLNTTNNYTLAIAGDTILGGDLHFSDGTFQICDTSTDPDSCISVADLIAGTGGGTPAPGAFTDDGAGGTVYDQNLAVTGYVQTLGGDFLDCDASGGNCENISEIVNPDSRTLIETSYNNVESLIDVSDLGVYMWSEDQATGLSSSLDIQPNGGVVISGDTTFDGELCNDDGSICKTVAELAAASTGGLWAGGGDMASYTATDSVDPSISNTVNITPTGTQFVGPICDETNTCYSNLSSLAGGADPDPTFDSVTVNAGADFTGILQEDFLMPEYYWQTTETPIEVGMITIDYPALILKGNRPFVGIGVEEPQAALDVAGDIIGQDVTADSYNVTDTDLHNCSFVEVDSAGRFYCADSGLVDCVNGLITDSDGQVSCNPSAVTGNGALIALVHNSGQMSYSTDPNGYFGENIIIGGFSSVGDGSAQIGNSVLIGRNTQLDYENSVLIGQGADITENNQVVIGQGVTGDSDYRVNIGNSYFSDEAIIRANDGAFIVKMNSSQDLIDFNTTSSTLRTDELTVEGDLTASAVKSNVLNLKDTAAPCADMSPGACTCDSSENGQMMFITNIGFFGCNPPGAGETSSHWKKM